MSLRRAECGNPAPCRRLTHSARLPSAFAADERGQIERAGGRHQGQQFAKCRHQDEGFRARFFEYQEAARL